MTLAIPNDLSLRRMPLFQQAFYVDPAANALRIGATNAGRIHIGR